MRPLTINRDDDRGAVLVWVALMLTVLLGMGALVVDVGALYAERRQLQNGADAAALAVAMDCAKDSDCNKTTGDAKTHADKYADMNANDGAAAIDSVCGVGPGLEKCVTEPAAAADKSAWVQVSTSTLNPDNSTKVDFVLAPVLDATNVGSTVHASAVATWGGIGGVTTIPVVMSVCEYVALGGTIDGKTFPTTRGYVYLHKDDPGDGCPGSPSGAKLPGGFGWLDTATACKVSATVGDWLGSDVGNDGPPSGCNPSTWLNQDVLIPLYNETQSSGSHGEYHIVGFAAFKVLGFKIKNDNPGMPGDGKCPNTSGNSASCLYGEFSKVTVTGGSGGGPDFGARTVSMIG